MKNLFKILLFTIIVMFVAGCIESNKTPGAAKPINLVKMSGQEMVQRLGTGEIAGFIMWEPYPAIAVTKGYGKNFIFSGKL